jgi:signal transduction histidine kinase/streptogramin lyase
MTFQSGPKEHYLAHDNVNSLLEDRSHNLWIGTIDGLNCIDLKTKKFRNYKKTDDPNSMNLLDNIIASVYIDERNRIWIGNWGKGLNIFDPANGNMLHYTTEAVGNKNIPNNYVHVLFEDSHARLWLGTRNGVCIYNKQLQSFTPWFTHFASPENNFFANNRVYCITEVTKGEMWFGTGNGIMTFHPVTKKIDFFRTGATDPYHINSNLVYSILEDKEGLIWIATMNGLSCFSPKKNQMRHYTHDPEQSNSLCDDFTISLCEDHRGHIWIGTSTGVNQFNKNDSTFTYFSIKDGLPSNIIYDIIEDKNQDLWFSTGSGLARRRGNEFKTFSVNEGLQGVEFNLKAVFQDDNRDLYFGGMEGLHAFHPDSLADNTFIPPVVITSFLKENNGKKQNLNVYTDKLELSYKDYSFTISYAALDFTQPSKNRYAYMMEGLRDEWEEVGNRPFVHFTNLPSGNYTFLVKGTNNDGVWNEVPTRLHIRIHPPWWRSHTAYGAYILMTFLLIIGVIGLRERNLQREKRHLEAGIQERTAEIARQKEELNDLNASKDKFFSILAHDLKNPFSSLYSMSQILDQNYESLDEEDKLTALTRIHQSAELIYNLLENLLTWSKSQRGHIEYAPSTFDLSVLVQENINLHSVPAEKKGIHLCNKVSGIHEVFADRQMINTVLRNLINNAIKFTQPGKEMTVSGRSRGKFLEVEIKDQGIGISKENLEKLFRIDVKYKSTGTSGEKGTGLGLILCHEFVHKNEGTIWCESQEGKGSSFFFTVPAEKPDHL